MQELLYISLLTSILVIGITISHSNETMWLYGLYSRVDGKKWAKPLITCEWCMPSVYSVFGYAGYFVIVGHFEYRLLFLYPFVVSLSSLMSGVAWQLVVLLFKIGNTNDKN